LENRISAAELASNRFKASNALGWVHSVGVAAITIGGAMIASAGTLGWIAGQLLLALAFVQWFIILHECGHETMFRSSRLNSTAGRIASIFSLIPWKSWKRVHASHHRWTGWQDLDPTTASLVPRKLGSAERAFINTSWRFWLPAFSILYRVGNYWNLPRLRKLYPGKDQWQPLFLGAGCHVVVCAAGIYLLGAAWVVKTAGVGLLLALMIEDPLLLSQHTHIPQNVSRGKRVRPFGAFEQESFTRSLKFPAWISRYVLFNFDAHELHHMYPFVPGYRLREIPYTPVNEVHWWTWLKTVKGLRAEHFLFQNQNDSGIRI
jgi:fatty acid desaturase